MPVLLFHMACYRLLPWGEGGYKADQEIPEKGSGWARAHSRASRQRWALGFTSQRTLVQLFCAKAFYGEAKGRQRKDRLAMQIESCAPRLL